MSTSIWLGLIFGGLALLGIGCVLLVLHYRPTVESARPNKHGQFEPVTGWKRALALLVGAPVFVAFFVLRAAGLFREPNER
jgi:hypothetical protein